MQKQLKIYFIIGLLLVAIGQIIAYYFTFSDLLHGAITGAGVGILIYVLLQKKAKINS